MYSIKQVIKMDIKSRQNYYEDFFKNYPDNCLFEVYDINKEDFIQFYGKDSSQVINKNTLIKELLNLEYGVLPEMLDHIIVLRYNKTDINFVENAVFVGKKHAYNNQGIKNE